MDVDEESRNAHVNTSMDTDVSDLLQAQSGDSLLGDVDVNLEDSFSETGEHHGDDPGVSSKILTPHTKSHSLIGDEPSRENISRRNDEDIPMIDLEICPEDCFDELRSELPRKEKTSGTLTVKKTIAQKEVKSLRKQIIPPTPSNTVEESRKTFQPVSFAGQRVVIGDSNLEECQYFIPDVIYKRATRFSDGKYNLMSCLEEVSNSGDVKTVVVSALSNCLNDKGIKFWRKTVEDYIGLISHFAKKRHDVKFYVLGPFLRTKPEDHCGLISPIISRLAKGFNSHNCKNVKVNSGFSVESRELTADGVHLNLTSKHRLFQHVTSLFTRKWDLHFPVVNPGKEDEKPVRKEIPKTSTHNSKGSRRRSKSPQHHSKSHCRSRSRSPRRTYSKNSQKERSRSPKRRSLEEEQRSDLSHGSLKTSVPKYHDYRRKPGRSQQRRPSRSPEYKERIIVADSDEACAMPEAKNLEKIEPITQGQFGDEPIVTSVWQSVETKFANRLGPPINSYSTGDEPAQEVGQRCIPAGFESSDEDSLFGFEFCREDLEEIVGERNVEDCFLDAPGLGSKKAKIPQPDKGSRQFVHRDICGQALNLLDVRDNFLREYLDARNLVRIEKTYKMPTFTLQQCQESLRPNQTLACPQVDYEEVRVFHSEPDEQEKKTGE